MINFIQVSETVKFHRYQDESVHHFLNDENKGGTAESVRPLWGRLFILKYTKFVFSEEQHVQASIGKTQCE